MSEETTIVLALALGLLALCAVGVLLLAAKPALERSATSLHNIAGHLEAINMRGYEQHALAKIDRERAAETAKQPEPPQPDENEANVQRLAKLLAVIDTTRRAEIEPGPALSDAGAEGFRMGRDAVRGKLIEALKAVAK